MNSKEYKKCRVDISKHFKNELERLKLDIIKLKNENASLQVENFTLKKDIQKYKNKLESILDNIRADIEERAKVNQNLNTDRARALCWCLDVIDKYKTKSEEE